jgi:hypothetical protein
MLSLRAHLRRVSALSLAIQIAAMAGGAIAAAAPRAAVDQICTCPGGDHATCPMHHPASGTGADDAARKRCVLQNAAAPGDAALLSLGVFVGILPSAERIIVNVPFVPVPALAVRALSRADLPDSPPPRA